MNYIQKAWLTVLKPVTYVLNDKLAKRSGWIGRFGRFFSIGPREFGYHPINRLLAFFNHITMLAMGFYLHKYSVMKSLTSNGYHMSRLFRVAGLTYVPFVLMWLTVMPFIFLNRLQNDVDGTDMQWLAQKAPYKGLPNNTLNHRVSAHFTEINNIYAVEMLKKYSTMTEEIKRERDIMTDTVKRTKYARQGYKYHEASTSPDNQ